VSVDRTGKRAGAPRRITHWSNEAVFGLSAAADGRRLAVTRGRASTDIYLADIDPAGGPLLNPRRLTLDDRDDNDPRWTPDGNTVLFTSNRGGKSGIYRQALDSRIAEAVTVGKEAAFGARMSPDGKAILFGSGDSPSSFSVMRVPLAGGTPQLVAATKGVTGGDCPRVATAPCVLSAVREGRLIFSSIDPLTGAGREVAALGAKSPYSSRWALSPDGACIAITGEGEDDVTLLTLAGGGQRKLEPEHLFTPQTVSWYPSSDALVVTGTTKAGRWVLLRMDVQGGSQILLESDHWVTDPAPSPDGRRLAYMARTWERNAWLLEGF
jgi:dipeptidyl aminopeptidase/acylaminoacyl peptidase